MEFNLYNKIFFFSGFILKKYPRLFKSLINYKSDSLRIIYYHVVSEKNFPYYFNNKTITPDEFELQINIFKKYYEIISLNEALEFAKNRQSLKNKLVITFDDGFKENYTIIAPILLKYKITGTFFLIGNCLNNKDLMWRNKLLVINKTEKNRLSKVIKYNSRKFQINLKGYKNLMDWSFKYLPMEKKENIVNSIWSETMDISVKEYLDKYNPYLTQIQIKEMSAAGFEFGSHSMSHPIFTKISYDNFKYEILTSINLIQEITNKRVFSFSYPFGLRANNEYEQKLLEEKPSLLDTFLGTRNKLNNFENNITQWERDNLEFTYEIAISRFLILAKFRNKI